MQVAEGVRYLVIFAVVLGAAGAAAWAGASAAAGSVAGAGCAAAFCCATQLL